MTFKHKKRSSEHRTANDEVRQADLFGGVGGRQASTPPRRKGGGYQNICTVLNFEQSVEQKKRDPRMDELQQMGLQRVWLDVAEGIGVDAMLKAWRIIDATQGNIGDDGRLLVPLRSYGTFLRFQRNRYIETLADLGFTPAAIRERLDKQLGEKLSVRHISRVAQNVN